MTSAPRNSLLALVMFAAIALEPMPAFAQPGVAIYGGTGKDGANHGLAIISHRDFWQHSFESGWRARAHLETSLTHIDGDGLGGNRLSVVGLTPTLRFEPPRSPGFLEFGIGANYFDQKDINSRKSVGTHFEFGDIIGLGLKFGQRRQFEIGYRLIHYSNAGIRRPNPGVDFHTLRLKSDF